MKTVKNDKTVDLKDDFEGVVLRRTMYGNIIINLSKLGERTATVISEAQIGEEVHIVESVHPVTSYIPDDTIIRGGGLHLNQIMEELSDLPDKALAELLITPQDLAKIDGKGLDFPGNSYKRVQQIKNYHGLYGMQVLDISLYESNEFCKSALYNNRLGKHLRDCFVQAQITEEPITSGLFVPTIDILCGQNIKSNLYSNRKNIAEKGDGFITTVEYPYNYHCNENGEEELPHHYFATPHDREVKFSDFSQDGYQNSYNPEHTYYSSRRVKSTRPVALIIHPMV